MANVSNLERGNHKIKYFMSYTEINFFYKNGNVKYVEETHNSFRSGWTIWKRMAEKYLPNHPNGFSLHNDDLIWKKLEELAKSKHLMEKNDRITLISSFDWAVVYKKDFQRLIDAFEYFDTDSSLPKQAEIIKHFMQDENCIAVSWNQTSVNENHWVSYKNKKPPYTYENKGRHYKKFNRKFIKRHRKRSYNLFVDKKHIDVFSMVDEVN